MAIALYVDNKLIKMAESLEQAKELAEPYILDKPGVRVERTAAPAAVQAWIYDYEARDWVEQI